LNTEHSPPQEIDMNSNIKTDSWFRLGFLTAMVLAGVLVVSGAFAEDQVRSETVNFKDLDVNTPAGLKELYGRIHAAAQRVCQGLDIPDLVEKACIRKAESEAIEKVNLPLLTAYYEIKTGRPTQTLSANR
jgi:UrcA family protein